MQAWENFLVLQERELGKATVDKWLRSFKVARFDACNLYLEPKDSFHALWFEEHMRQSVETNLVGTHQKPIQVHLLSPKKEHSAPKSAPRPLARPIGLPTPAFDTLDSDATLDHFVPSHENRLILKVIHETLVALHTAESLPLFNPLFICGKSGAGKSHLLMAIASALKVYGKNVLYTRAETFTEHVVHAIRSGEMQSFRKTYRLVDALLVDDVDVFGRKAATQEEFFHTFNALQLENKQIILSSRCLPQELTHIEPRLISRFEWGIVLPLAPLSEEEVVVALRARMARAHLPLEEEVYPFLLETFSTQMKVLNRALETLLARTQLNRNLGRPPPLPLSLRTAKSYLAELIQAEEKNRLTPQKIIQAVAEQYGIHPEDILGKKQQRPYALARQLAMHLCREKLQLSYVKIGDLFSHRNHSTVMTSVRQIQEGLAAPDGELAAVWRRVVQQLG